MSGHGEKAGPRPPVNESERLFKKDLPVPKTGRGDIGNKLNRVRDFFSFRKKEKPAPEAVEFFEHELVDNKKKLLQEINKTIEGEVAMVLEDIKTQIRTVQAMLEHGVLNGNQAETLIKGLEVKKFDAQQAAAAVAKEMAQTENMPENQAPKPQPEQRTIKKERVPFKRASEIFAAIQKGKIMAADTLTKEEKLLILNTLNQKYKEMGDSAREEGYLPYEGDRKNYQRKIDNSDEYDFYLELANRIGFDGVDPVKRKTKNFVDGQRVLQPFPSHGPARPTEHLGFQKPPKEKPTAVDTHGHSAGHEASHGHDSPPPHTPNHPPTGGGGGGHHPDQHPAPTHTSEHPSPISAAPTPETPTHIEPTPVVEAPSQPETSAEAKIPLDNEGEDEATESTIPTAVKSESKPEAKPIAEVKKTPDELMIESLRDRGDQVVFDIITNIENGQINIQNANKIIREIFSNNPAVKSINDSLPYIIGKIVKSNKLELAKLIAELGTDENAREWNRNRITIELINAGEMNSEESLAQNIDSISNDNMRDEVIKRSINGIAKFSETLAKKYFNKIVNEDTKSKILASLETTNLALAEKLKEVKKELPLVA